MASMATVCRGLARAVDNARIRCQLIALPSVPRAKVPRVRVRGARGSGRADPRERRFCVSSHFRFPPHHRHHSRQGGEEKRELHAEGMVRAARAVDKKGAQ